ncbi:MAG: alpha/beta fold hydrolase [Flavobacteriaceae bacterium]
MNMGLEYLHRLPKNKNQKNPPLLLLIHGYGSNEADLFSFADHLPDEFLVVSVRAPLTLGYQSYAWYTINFNDADGNYSDTPEALKAKENILQFLSDLQNELPYDAKNVTLLGFSQGTILSYALALSYPEKFKNIIALSGYIKEELISKPNDTSLYKNLDIFISHGIQDQVIPLQWAEKAPKFLNALGINNCFKTYLSGHGVTPQNFNDLNQWLLTKL